MSVLVITHNNSKYYPHFVEATRKAHLISKSRRNSNEVGETKNIDTIDHEHFIRMYRCRLFHYTRHNNVTLIKTRFVLTH